MATQQKILFRGDVPTVRSSVYSVPSSSSAVITSIAISNTTSNPLAFSMWLGNIAFLFSVQIAQNDTIFVDTKQVLNEFDAIEMTSSLSGMTVHINGVEIS